MNVDPEDLRHLAAAMAHEVRNPLNTLAIRADILEGLCKKGDLSREKLLSSIEVMQREIERASEILQDYLDGMSEEPDAPLTPEDVGPVLRRAFEDVRAEVGPTVEMDLVVGQDLSPLLFEPKELQRAFAALIRYSATHASPKRLKVVALAGESAISIKIAHPSAPLSPEEVKHFFHVGGAVNRFALAAAKQIIRSYGGSISVGYTSPEAAFAVTLPVL